MIPTLYLMRSAPQTSELELRRTLPTDLYAHGIGAMDKIIPYGFLAWKEAMRAHQYVSPIKESQARSLEN